MKKLSVLFFLALFFCSVNAASLEEVMKNADGQKFVMAIFYKTADTDYTVMKNTVEVFLKKPPAPAVLHTICVDDTKETAVIEKYRITSASLPLLLVFAPNGVITGGVPQKVSAELSALFPSDTELKVLKPLQNGKITFVSVQNEKTKFNKESLDAVNTFVNDANLEDISETVLVNPSDPDSKKFLESCRLSSDIKDTHLLVILPPGTIVGNFPGKVSAEEIKFAVTLAMSGSTCGSGGCPSSSSGTCSGGSCSF